MLVLPGGTAVGPLNVQAERLTNNAAPPLWRQQWLSWTLSLLQLSCPKATTGGDQIEALRSFLDKLDQVQLHTIVMPAKKFKKQELYPESAYIMHCSTLAGWSLVEKGKVKKASSTSVRAAKTL
ncbi:hypothetical protein WMY93_031989 [Mugilogobius chulae]|uniref:Uncharacterized protein n=1 Tax=Mugilogobius chulae TaxID=88201 RepID=A0AAW0MCN5_9GOBI